MNTSRPVSTKEADIRIINNLDSDYKKDDIEEELSNKYDLNVKQKDKLPRILTDFEDIFYGTLLQ